MVLGPVNESTSCRRWVLCLCVKELRWVAAREGAGAEGLSPVVDAVATTCRCCRGTKLLPKPVHVSAGECCGKTMKREPATGNGRTVCSWELCLSNRAPAVLAWEETKSPLLLSLQKASTCFIAGCRG